MRRKTRTLSHPLHIILVWTVSLLVHLVFLNGMQHLPKPERSIVRQKVSINVVEKPKALSDAEAPAPSPKPARAKPMPASKLPKPSANTSAPPTQPVLGLSKESFAEGGKGGIAVPAGNTTMVEDEGKRLSPEQIKKLDRDLSEDAELIPGSYIIPEYTPEAEDAGLEGSFVVDIYVEANGLVSAAELKTKIGYGMDQKVLEATKKSRFYPRKNPLGRAVAGWTELKVRLALE